MTRGDPPRNVERTLEEKRNNWHASFVFYEFEHEGDWPEEVPMEKWERNDLGERRLVESRMYVPKQP